MDAVKLWEVYAEVNCGEYGVAILVTWDKDFADYVASKVKESPDFCSEIVEVREVRPREF